MLILIGRDSGVLAADWLTVEIQIRTEQPGPARCDHGSKIIFTKSVDVPDFYPEILHCTTSVI